MDSAWVNAERSTLEEGENGDARVSDKQVEIRHAARADHADIHEDWLRRVGQDGLDTGHEIWIQRESLFPRLVFLPGVQAQLRGLKPDWVRPVAEALLKLNRALAAWNPDAGPLPDWETNVTREFEQRRRLCKFTDVDGETRTFDWHARFRPGPGRAHFRLVAEDHSARIAYIGRKIGA